MPAAISSSGTWSALDSVVANTVDRQLPRQTNTGVEQWYDQNSLNHAYSLANGGLNGFPEVIQFAGLMAAGYSIGTVAALERIVAIAQAMLKIQMPSTLRDYPANSDR